MDYIYQVASSKTFEDAVAAVQNQTQAKGFRVQYIHDVQATLVEKGFKRAPLKIIEVCNAKFAFSALEIDVLASLLMPCRINVYLQAGKTIISTIRPNALVPMLQNPELEQFAKEIEDIIIEIIDSSK